MEEKKQLDATEIWYVPLINNKPDEWVATLYAVPTHCARLVNFTLPSYAF